MIKAKAAVVAGSKPRRRGRMHRHMQAYQHMHKGNTHRMSTRPGCPHVLLPPSHTWDLQKLLGSFREAAAQLLHHMLGSIKEVPGPPEGGSAEQGTRQ